MNKKHITLFTSLLVTALVAVLLLPGLTQTVLAQTGSLTVTPLTWNVIGLDSNSPTTGPRDFPVGAEVCNKTTGTLTNVNVTFAWASANANINLQAGLNPIVIPTLAPNACYDAYFQVEVNQVAAAYDTTRRYTITASDGTITGTSPTPRELYVEHLVSQNRNATLDVLYGPDTSSLTSVPAGGTMGLIVGNTYAIRLKASTATQGYEQLESFLTLPNVVFQILDVQSTYSADSSANVSSPNPSLYADGCVWVNDPNAPNYRSCTSTGKTGGTLDVTYTVKILSGGGTSKTLNSLIYDFSGSSYHYNADYSLGARTASIIDPSNSTIAKSFTPSTITSGGVSTLSFTLTNPNGATVSGYNFVDNLPTGVTVASPPSASTTGCGTPTFTPAAGNTSLSFSNGTIAANGTCTISVKVTSSTVATHNNTTNHLFVNSLDTGKTATASLTVNSTPPPPTCVSGIPVATWNFLTGSSNTNPAPTTLNVSSATASAGSGLVPVISTENIAGASGAWSSDNVSNSPTLSTAANEYFEFAINTTGFESLTLSFQARRTPQGPQSVQLYYGSTTPGTASSTYSISSASTWFAFGPTTITANSSGTTYVRLYVYNAGNDSSGHSIHIDGVTFTGCGVPSAPTLTKNFAPDPIGATGSSTLTFTITNPNTTIALSNLSFSDTLPSGMSVATTPAASKTCTGGTWTPANGDTTLSYTGGSIAAGASCTLQVNVTAATANVYGNFSGYISSTESGTNNTATGSASDSLTVLAPPQISKVFSPSPILAGGTSTLTITISNPNLNNAISGVAFTDTFPTSPGAMVVASPTGASSTCGGTFTPAIGAGSVSLTNGTLAAGASCTLKVNVTAPTVGSYSNTTGNVSHILNSVTFNGNTANSTLTVAAPNPGISVSKQISTSATGPWSTYIAVTENADVYYRFTVENTGDVPLNPVSVSDPLVAAASGCTWPAPLPVADANDEDHIATCVVGPITAATGTHPNVASASGTYSGTPYTDPASNTATYATTGLTLDKTADKTSFTLAGEVITYTFTVRNSGFAVLSGPVTINDDKTTNETCPSLTTVGDLDEFFDPAEQIICTGTYTVTAADKTAGSVVNTATASSGGVTSPSDSVTVTATQADLSVTKSASSAAPVFGSTITFTITVTNGGPDAATNVSVLDQLPAGYTFVSSTPSQGTYDNGTGVWTVGTINNGANATLGITVTVNATGPYANTAQVSASDQNDPDSTPNNSIGTEDDQATSTPVPIGVADLSLTKTVDNATPDVGSNVTFTITVTNGGPNTATGVHVLDQLPAGYTYVSSTPSQGGYNNGTGIWTVGSINNGASATLTITATVNAAGPYANTAQVSEATEDDPDSDPNNNNPAEDDQATNTPTPVPITDLHVAKTINNPAPSSGDTVIYTITLSNSGPNDATGLEISDTIPVGTTFISATPSQGTYDNGTGVWTVGALANGANATLQISVTINVSTPVTNTAQVSASDQKDPDSTPNNSDPAEDDQASVTTGQGSADLSIAKDVDNATPTVGSNITFTLTLTNSGPDSATNVTVIDQLPAGYTYVSNTPSQGTYNNGTGVWTVGTVANGAAPTLQIVATVNPVGPYANTAQVSASNQVDPDSTPNNNNATEDDQATNTPVPIGVADLSLTKTVDNATPNVGTNVTFTITVSNAGPSAATNVTVLDQLPAGYTYVSSTATDGLYDNISGIWVIGTINSGSNSTLDITATVNAAGPYANTAQVSASDQNDPDSTPNNSVGTEDDQATSTPTPVPVADLSLTKTVNNATPNVGSNITFTITISNAGPSAATNVTVADQLPAGYTFVSSTPSQGTYDNGTGVWTVGTINSGANATLAITVTVNATGPYANTAQVSAATETDPDSTPNNSVGTEDDQATSTPTPIPVADLSLTKTVDNATPNVGTNVTFTITISNAGPSAATNVTVIDQLPAGFTFVSSAPSQGTYDNGTGVWTVGTINSGANATLGITVTVNAAGPYANTAQVSASDQNDPDSTPNNSVGTEDDQATSTPAPTAIADLSLTKTVNNATPNVGTNVTFTITVSNAGPSAASTVSVADQLPAGYTFVSSAPSQGTYDNGTGVWTVGTLANGANATLGITATVNAVGPYANTAQVSASDQTDSDSTPNNSVGTEDDQAEATTTPAAIADLSIAKDVDNATPNVGSNITFTITVSNAGPSAATNVSVADQLPAGFTFVSSAPSQGTYDNGTGVWTVGTINSGANATLGITATVNTAGPYANTAQVSAATETDPDSTPNNNNPAEDDQATNTPAPVPVADLSLTKTVDNSTPNVGSNVTFTITISNAGPSAATNVTVLDQLPGGFTFVSSVPSQGTYDNGTGVWTVGTINSGSNSTLDITATVNATGPYANTAQVSASDQTDSDSTPNNSVDTEDDQATSTPTPAGVADLSLTKTVDNATPDVGSNITFTITVSNAGPSAATNVAVLDQLPTGYTFVSSTTSQGTYDNGTGVWTVGTINNGANATLGITVTVNAAGPYANTAQVSASDQTDSDSTPNNSVGTEDDQATSTPTPVPVADLSLTKTVDNATPNVGSNITFTITVSNAGPSAATNVTVLDQLPAGYTFVSSAPSQGTYDNGTGIWTVGTINNGANATLGITVTVNATGPYANTAQVSASDQKDPDSTPNNSVDTEDDQATSTPGSVDVADLSVLKTVDNATPDVGSSITFTVTVSNAGPSAATGVSIEDQLPAGYTYLSDTPSQGTYDDATGLWTVGTINSGANATLQIVVRVNATGPYANTAQVNNSDQNDPDSTPDNDTPGEDDQNTNTPTPIEIADLHVAKAINNPDPTIGTNVIYTITLSNAGPNDATNVQVMDLLPAEVTFVSSVPSQGTYDNATGAWDIGSVANGANATLAITATINVGGFITNSAQVSAADQKDPDSTPNNGIGNGEDDQASVTTPQGIADLSLTKSVDNTAPAIGGNITFTITLSNAGPDNATNVTVQDQLPAGYTYVSDAPSQGTYNSVTGIWTVGTINSGANATLSITVTVNPVGPYANTAQVATSDQFDPDSVPNNNSTEDDLSSVTPAPGKSGPAPTLVPPGQPTPVVMVVDPVITKSVNPPFSQPGELVTWTITVSNPGSLTATNIIITDTMPSEVEILNVSATGGSISFADQVVSFNLSALTGGQSVTITINARVRSNVQMPFIITNSASITNAENPNARYTQAQLIGVAELPGTGETPWWRTPLLGLITVAAGSIVLAALRWWLKSRGAHST